MHQVNHKDLELGGMSSYKQIEDLFESWLHPSPFSRSLGAAAKSRVCQVEGKQSSICRCLKTGSCCQGEREAGALLLGPGGHDKVWAGNTVETFLGNMWMVASWNVSERQKAST